MGVGVREGTDWKEQFYYEYKCTFCENYLKIEESKSK